MRGEIQRSQLAGFTELEQRPARRPRPPSRKLVITDTALLKCHTTLKDTQKASANIHEEVTMWSAGEKRTVFATLIVRGIS